MKNNLWYRKYNGNNPFKYNTTGKYKYGRGIYFSNQKDNRFEGEKQIAAKINFTNPKIFDGTVLPNIDYHKQRVETGFDVNEFTDSLFEQGYDAIIIKHSDKRGDELIIRKPALVEIIEELANGGTTLLAPNGKPSNLTPEQYKLVRTPEFKAWFGDWENAPETASKVVDENGEPLVVYHGSPYGGITVFDRSSSAKESSGLKEFGTYFATNKKIPHIYAYWSVL